VKNKCIGTYTGTVWYIIKKEKKEHSAKLGNIRKNKSLLKKPSIKNKTRPYGGGVLRRELHHIQGRWKVMVKNEWKACIITPLDQWLIVSQMIGFHNSQLVAWKGFKETESVSCCIVKRDQEEQLSVSEHNSENNSNADHCRTQNFNHHYIAYSVVRALGDNFVRKNIAGFQQLSICTHVSV
jgi:hypothetical protein